MIYTVTFNPSLDYMVTVENFALGYTNRSADEEIFAGGKGINVSFVLQNLGHDSVALGFLAGFVGDEILRKMPGIKGDFIKLQEGNSRINVKIKNLDGTEINGQGPHIPDADVKTFFDKVKSIKEDDILVLAGSIPGSLSSSIYMDILQEISCKNVVVDATGQLLLNTLPHKPFLIKPNIHELEEIFEVKIETQEEIAKHARQLQEKGARNVIISMGGKGALLVDEEDKVHFLECPKGELISAVGSGDSMVAGFLAGYLEKKDYAFAFKKAVATGSGSAFSQHFASKELVEQLMATL